MNLNKENLRLTLENQQLKKKLELVDYLVGEFREKVSEAETKRAMEILARPERDEEVIVMLADAVEFWADRCERVEKQRDELIKALEMLEKIFADKDFIDEDESEDFLTDLWCKARNPVLKVRGEVE